MSEPENRDISYRGGKLTEEDQAKIKAEHEEHKDDVSHVKYRGAEDDVKLHEEPEKHKEHIQYRGAEDDREV